MYQYRDIDRDFVRQRVEQFRDQVRRRLDGDLSEDEFKPLRLMNGVYLQLHAYMLRVAIPYGTLSSDQMRRLAHIARRYDKGFGHFTTRQNVQFNWPKLIDIPDILGELADVDMHAIQTSGNCIRNVTADHFAGVAADEVDDPRIYGEIIRQWSTLHPEFTFLPRKFKIAVTGSPADRAATRFHDIGLILRKGGESGDRIGFEVVVGGGQGRTPMVAKTIRDFVPEQDMLSYLEAILRVYNMLGRRDNKYKARIKILLHETGVEKFTQLVEDEWRHIKDGPLVLPVDTVAAIRADFALPPYQDAAAASDGFEPARVANPDFDLWVTRNVHAHKQPGYAIATVSLKPVGGIPGDATAEQMDAVADLADRFSLGEIRVSHEQNLVFAHVRRADLFALWQALQAIGLATANEGLVSDIIACPGLDYCALANARSIPVSQRISSLFDDMRKQHDIGELKIKISGCINACGHHHVGHIGILGVDRRGTENYQITLGGDAGPDANIGTIIGPGFDDDGVVAAVKTLIHRYLDIRDDGERFIDTFRRAGVRPFKEAVYGSA